MTAPLAPWNVLNRAFRSLGEDGIAILLITAIVYVVPAGLMNNWVYDLSKQSGADHILSYWKSFGFGIAAYTVSFSLHGLRLGIAGQILNDRWRDKRKRPIPFAFVGIGLIKGLRGLWLYVPLTALSFFLFYAAWGIGALPVQLLSFGLVTSYVVDGLSLRQAWRFNLSMLKGHLWPILANIIVIDMAVWLATAGLQWVRVWSLPSQSILFREWAVAAPLTILSETFLFAWMMSLFFAAREQSMGKVEYAEKVFE